MQLTGTEEDHLDWKTPRTTDVVESRQPLATHLARNFVSMYMIAYVKLGCTGWIFGTRCSCTGHYLL